MICCSGLVSPASVTYEVVEYSEADVRISNAQAQVTYRNEGAGTEMKDVRLRGRSFQASPETFFIAQNRSGAYGLTVNIRIDGKIVKTSTSTGGLLYC